jgi:hypothetical protein
MHETTSSFITYSVFILVIEAFAGQMLGLSSVRPFQSSMAAHRNKHWCMLQHFVRLKHQYAHLTAVGQKAIEWNSSH